MRSVIALLTSFAFATTNLAAPTPLRTVTRSVPDIKAVIRNPIPIDHRLEFSSPGVTVDMNFKDVQLDKPVPSVDKVTGIPVNIVNRAQPDT